MSRNGREGQFEGLRSSLITMVLIVNQSVANLETYHALYFAIGSSATRSSRTNIHSFYIHRLRNMCSNDRSTPRMVAWPSLRS